MQKVGINLGAYDPVKDRIYSIFVNYFNNPKMVKIKDVENYSLYGVKVYSLLGIQQKYIMAFLPKDNNKCGNEVQLAELQWVSLQTRLLSEEHQLPTHHYIPKKMQYLDREITLEHKDKEQYKYTVESMPIQVTLLAKEKSDFEYHNKGTLITALETYQTIINFL